MPVSAPAPVPAIAERPCLFISGAATGIGLATARLFANRGWLVGMADSDVPTLQQAAHAIGPDKAMALPLDVTDAAQWQQALATFCGHTGRLDLLVNNAGILCSGPFEATTLAQHHAQLAVNIHGVLNGCHAAHPYLAATPGACVINLASSAAFYGQASLAGYSASKFAVKGLTEALNIEWQRQGIRVCDILPLFVQTGMVKGMNAPSMHRLGVRLQPEDVAAVIWQAARHKGWSKVHWPAGLQARIMYKLSGITPDWINRAVAKWIAT